VEVGAAYKETYDWFFDRPVGFKDWLEGKDAITIYWIQGKPSSGKSTIARHAMNQLLTRDLLHTYDRGFWVVVGYFFHNRGEMVQKSVAGFLRELLYQILRQRKELSVLIYSLFSKLYDEHRLAQLTRAEEFSSCLEARETLGGLTINRLEVSI
jgi:hypothetical protein